MYLIEINFHHSFQYFENLHEYTITLQIADSSLQATRIGFTRTHAHTHTIDRQIEQTDIYMFNPPDAYLFKFLTSVVRIMSSH